MDWWSKFLVDAMFSLSNLSSSIDVDVAVVAAVQVRIALCIIKFKLGCILWMAIFSMVTMFFKCVWKVLSWIAGSIRANQSKTIGPCLTDQVLYLRVGIALFHGQLKLDISYCICPALLPVVGFLSIFKRVIITHICITQWHYLLHVVVIVIWWNALMNALDKIMFIEGCKFVAVVWSYHTRDCATKQFYLIIEGRATNIAYMEGRL